MDESMLIHTACVGMACAERLSIEGTVLVISYGTRFRLGSTPDELNRRFELDYLLGSLCPFRLAPFYLSIYNLFIFTCMRLYGIKFEIMPAAGS